MSLNQLPLSPGSGSRGTNPQGTAQSPIEMAANASNTPVTTQASTHFRHMVHTKIKNKGEKYPSDSTKDNTTSET